MRWVGLHYCCCWGVCLVLLWCIQRNLSSTSRCLGSTTSWTVAAGNGANTQDHTNTGPLHPAHYDYGIAPVHLHCCTDLTLPAPYHFPFTCIDHNRTTLWHCMLDSTMATSTLAAHGSGRRQNLNPKQKKDLNDTNLNPD